MSTAPAVAQKRGKGALITGAVLLVLGIILTFLGDRRARGHREGDHGHPAHRPQDRLRRSGRPSLAAATTYGVYDEKGKATVPASDVTVTASDGTALTVKTSDTAEVKGEGGKTFTEVANFTIGTSGTFTIKVATKDAVVAVAPVGGDGVEGLRLHRRARRRPAARPDRPDPAHRRLRAALEVQLVLHHTS